MSGQGETEKGLVRVRERERYPDERSRVGASQGSDTAHNE